MSVTVLPEQSHTSFQIAVLVVIGLLLAGHFFEVWVVDNYLEEAAEVTISCTHSVISIIGFVNAA